MGGPSLYLYYLNSLDSTCLPTPPRPPLPIHQSTNPPSHPPIINPGLIPRRPASRHPPAARFAQHGAPWGNCACILGRAATAPLLHSRRRLFASPSPRLASTSDHLRIQSCLAPACLLLIWSLSGVNRIRFLPRCKTSTAFARIRASATTSAPCCISTPRPSSTDKQQPSSSPRHLTGLSPSFLSVCRSGSHPRPLLLPGVLLYCRALKPTKQASHRIASHCAAAHRHPLILQTRLPGSLYAAPSYTACSVVLSSSCLLLALPSAHSGSLRPSCQRLWSTTTCRQKELDGSQSLIERPAHTYRDLVHLRSPGLDLQGWRTSVCCLQR